MNRDNNIDKLFSEKLNGREIDGYHASAWKGAEGMLDQHFRLLLLKRVVISAFVAGAVSVVALLLIFDSSSQPVQLDTGTNKISPTLSNSPTGNDSGEINSFTLSPSPANEGSSSADDDSKNSSVSKVADHVTNHTSTAAVQVDSDVPSIQTAKVSSSTDPSKITTQPKENAKTAVNNLQSPQLTSNRTRPTAADPKVVGDVDHADNRVNSSRTQKQIDNTLRTMPVFGFESFEINANSTIADRDLLSREKLMQELRKVDLKLVGCTGLANGFQNLNNSKESPSLLWSGGLSIQYNFNARFYARSGAQLTSRNSLASRRSKQTTLTGQIYSAPRNLMYVDIPFQCGYNFGARHSIFFGMTFSPLVGYLDFEEHTNVVTDDGQEKMVDRTAKGLGRDGFAGFDVAGSLGYTFQISERFEALADVRFGLFDVTDNAYFGTPVIDDRNHQFRIGLSYRLLSR